MARIGSSGVRVTGLKELNAALNRLGPEFKGEMRKVNKSVADFVAPEVKSAAASLGSTAAHVAPSIKASAGAGFAGVSGDGAAFAGAEFGGRGRPTTQQFQPWRGSGEGAGYFMFPTIRQNLDQIEEKYAEGADALIKKAGLK